MKNLRAYFSNGIAGLLAVVFLTLAPVEAGAAEGRVLVDWSTQTVGEPAKSPGAGVTIRLRHGAKPVIVGGESEQVSPFAGKGVAIGMPNRADALEGEATVLRVPLFDGKASPPKGWAEAEVAVEGGHLTFGPVLGATPSFAIYFVRDGRILLVHGKREDNTRERLLLNAKTAPGAVHTFRIEWELDGAKPGFRFSLDGKALALPDGSDVYPVDLAGATVTGLRFGLNGGGTYVGTVRASE